MAKRRGTAKLILAAFAGIIGIIGSVVLASNCLAQAPLTEQEQKAQREMQQPPAVPAAADGTYPAVDRPSGGPVYEGPPPSAQTVPAKPGEAGGPEALGPPPNADESVVPDPFMKFNESMFTFNRKLDEYVLRPVASGYAKVLPVSARQGVGRFFDNIGFIPRTVNNALQLKPVPASTELGRFLINTTLGLAGFFDVADDWFGIKQEYQDFGLTMGHYGVGMGPYLMLPFFGPSSVRDAVGLGVDGAMNPMSYLLPFWISISANTGWRATSAVNYRSLNLELFQDADRYSVDLYGAVQDAYVESRKRAQK